MNAVDKNGIEKLEILLEIKTPRIVIDHTVSNEMHLEFARLRSIPYNFEGDPSSETTSQEEENLS